MDTSDTVLSILHLPGFLSLIVSALSDLCSHQEEDTDLVVVIVENPPKNTRLSRTEIVRRTSSI